MRNKTFLKVFPFSILINSQMKITQMGKSIEKLFPNSNYLIGNFIDQIFKLIRPDIPFQFDKVSFFYTYLSYLFFI